LSNWKIDGHWPPTICIAHMKFQIQAFCMCRETARRKIALLVSHQSTHSINSVWCDRALIVLRNNSFKHKLQQTTMKSSTPSQRAFSFCCSNICFLTNFNRSSRDNDSSYNAPQHTTQLVKCTIVTSTDKCRQSVHCHSLACRFNKCTQLPVHDWKHHHWVLLDPVLHARHLFTCAIKSHGSMVFMHVCVWVSVCPQNRTKTAETTITKIATGIVHHKSWLPI